MEEEALARELGALIRTLRRERGYSQERFAYRCGIERAYMSSIERGKVSVSVRLTLRMAKGLDLPLSSLFRHLESKNL